MAPRLWTIVSCVGLRMCGSGVRGVAWEGGRHGLGAQKVPLVWHRVAVAGNVGQSLQGHIICAPVSPAYCCVTAGSIQRRRELVCE